MDRSKKPVTYESAHHNFCEKSGFCKRCGAHQEYVKFENLLCVWAENTTAITHIRAAQIDADKQIAKALQKLRSLTSEPKPAS